MVYEKEETGDRSCCSVRRRALLIPRVAIYNPSTCAISNGCSINISFQTYISYFSDVTLSIYQKSAMRDFFEVDFRKTIKSRQSKLYKRLYFPLLVALSL